MNISKFSLILCSAVLVLCSAKTHALSTEEILKNIPEAKISEYAFTQDKYLADADSHLVSSGKALFVKNKGIIWKQQNPFEIKIVINDKEFLEIIDDEVSKLSFTDNPQMFSISKLIMSLINMDIKNLSDDFKYTLDGTINHWEIRLIPIDPTLKKVFRKILLKGESSISEVILESTTDDITTLRFSNQKKIDKLEPDEDSKYFD